MSVAARGKGIREKRREKGIYISLENAKRSIHVSRQSWINRMLNTFISPEVVKAARNCIDIHRPMSSFKITRRLTGESAAKPYFRIRWKNRGRR